MAEAQNRHGDTCDLIEDSLEILAQRRAKYPADDLVAIRLLADLVNETEAALAERVAQARGGGVSWQAIAEALTSTVTEVRLRFDDPS